jgi:phenylalanyl-tRNA synthetase alpha chain
MEVLGCGVLRDGVLKNAGIDTTNHTAWAFGIGIERLAMRLFKIKDIRLFWSDDKRFLNQFKSGKIVEFKAISKFPACYKDFTFYVDNKFEETDFHQLVRDCAGDTVEEVKCLDTFTKDDKTSKCFRVNFRHMSKSLTNSEINDLQFKIRDGIKDVLKLELR